MNAANEIVCHIVNLGQPWLQANASDDLDVQSIAEMINRIVASTESGAEHVLAEDDIHRICGAAQHIVHAVASESPDCCHAIATSLFRLGDAMESIHRNEAAAKAYEASMHAFQSYACATGADVRAQMSAAINNFGVARMREGAYDAAIQAFLEAIKIASTFEDDGGIDHRLSLARAWHNLAVAQGVMRRFHEAHAALLNSITIRAWYAQVNHEQGSPLLAESLTAHGVLLASEGRHAEAITAYMSAFDTLLPAFRSDPAAHMPRVRRILRGALAACNACHRSIAHAPCTTLERHVGEAHATIIEARHRTLP